LSREIRLKKLRILLRNVVLAQFFTGFPVVMSGLHYRTAKVRFEAHFRTMVFGVLQTQPKIK